MSKITLKRRVSSKEKENIHKALKTLRHLAEKQIPLQQKVDMMNQEMIKLLKPTFN